MVERVSIYGSDVEYKVIRRNIKYPRLEFKTGNLLLVLPEDYSEPSEIIEKHKDWIYQRDSIIKKALKDAQRKNLNLQRTVEELRDLVYSAAEEFSKELKLDINKIYLKKMRSKWASCSSRKNLTVNTALRYLPESLIKYVVFHEMIHLIERKHTGRFWGIISQKFTDYQKKENDLLVYWFLIQSKTEDRAKFS
jgi:hypothetical protein